MDTKIILVICAAIFILIVLSFLFRFVFVYQKKTIAFHTEKELLQAQYQEELLRSQLEIQEQTIKNISQEIHDNIGQTLSLVKLHLNRIDLDKLQPTSERIEDSKLLLTKAIHDLRSISKTMNTDVISSAGLQQVVKYQLQDIEKTGEFKTEFIVNGDQYSLGSEKELIIFRIIQEALNNTIKHSAAKEIKVICDYKPGKFQLVVMDNGQGIEKNNDKSFIALGSGLHNMANRTRLIGGQFSINSNMSGTKIIIDLPISNSNGNNNRIS